MEQKINADYYNAIKKGFESDDMGVVLDIFKILAEQDVLEKYLEVLSIDLDKDYLAKKLELVIEKLFNDARKRI
jgi:hypothetical protein